VREKPFERTIRERLRRLRRVRGETERGQPQE